MKNCEKLWHDGLARELGLTSNSFQLCRPCILLHGLGFGTEATLQKLLGNETYQKWSDDISRITPRPAPTKLPSIFLNWAMLRAPNLATAGASVLAQAALTDAELCAKLQSSSAVRFTLPLTGSAILVDVQFQKCTVIESLVVVDGIHVQAEVTPDWTHAAWPLYIPDSDIATNTVESNPSGTTTLTLTTSPGHPVVIAKL